MVYFKSAALVVALLARRRGAFVEEVQAGVSLAGVKAIGMMVRRTLPTLPGKAKSTFRVIVC
jgi:hypothetical protein